MSSVTEELQKQFQALIKVPDMVFPATVKEVDKDEKTITVVADELEYADVRLTANVDDKDKVVLFPKQRSSVLVGLIGNDENTLYVVSMSEIESIAGTIGDSVFEIDTDGYHITRDGVNIKEVLMDGFINQNKLNQELQKVIVSIGVTPNVPALEAIKTDNEQVINNIQKVFK